MLRASHAQQCLRDRTLGGEIPVCVLATTVARITVIKFSLDAVFENTVPDAAAYQVVAVSPFSLPSTPSSPPFLLPHSHTSYLDVGILAIAPLVAVCLSTPSI